MINNSENTNKVFVENNMNRPDIKSSDLNNIPMSKSVIVTSSDSSNYKRMTRSTISRQTSK